MTQHPEFESLLEIMRTLRGPGGCPWDLKQTIDTVTPFVLEEAAEVADAAASGKPEALREELGDLLLQIVFLSRIAEEQGLFDIRGVCRGITEKLIFRHPHIFSDSSAETPEQVVDLWNDMKREEKRLAGIPDHPSILDGVPRSLPALNLAAEIQKKASKVGFDWPEISGVFEKVAEETAEFRESLENNDTQAMEEEMGDLLFSVVNLARFAGIDPEMALRKCVQKFKKRFSSLEKTVENEGRNLAGMTLAEMDAVWDRIKAAARES